MARIPESLAPHAAVPGPPNRAGSLVAWAFDLVFPPRCAGCGEIGSGFCLGCQARITRVTRPYCPSCGRSLPRTTGCQQCLANPPTVNGLFSAGLYRDPLSQAVRQFKYRGQSHLALTLGRLMMACWAQQGLPVDLVLAVPLHASRLRQRGFNQAWLLGQAFCRTAKLPLLREGLLCRQRATPQQALLRMEDRQRNMANAFSWQGPGLQGLRLLLVDDVVTSGSTLKACAAVLRENGASDVWAITVARARTLPGRNGPA